MFSVWESFCLRFPLLRSCDHFVRAFSRDWCWGFGCLAEFELLSAVEGCYPTALNLAPVILGQALNPKP